MKNYNVWYRKFDLKKRQGTIACPNCGVEFEEQILYSLDTIPCSDCDTPIFFIRTIDFIYIFDMQRAPNLFQKIYIELKIKPLNEAYCELLEVTKVFKCE